VKRKKFQWALLLAFARLTNAKTTYISVESKMVFRTKAHLPIFAPLWIPPGKNT
jgi:hypothetical protein